MTYDIPAVSIDSNIAFVVSAGQVRVYQQGFGGLNQWGRTASLVGEDGVTPMHGSIIAREGHLNVVEPRSFIVDNGMQFCFAPRPFIFDLGVNTNYTLSGVGALIETSSQCVAAGIRTHAVASNAMVIGEPIIGGQYYPQGGFAGTGGFTLWTKQGNTWVFDTIVELHGGSGSQPYTVFAGITNSNIISGESVNPAAVEQLVVRQHNWEPLDTLAWPADVPNEFFVVAGMYVSPEDSLLVVGLEYMDTIANVMHRKVVIHDLVYPYPMIGELLPELTDVTDFGDHVVLRGPYLAILESDDSLHLNVYERQAGTTEWQLLYRINDLDTIAEVDMDMNANGDVIIGRRATLISGLYKPGYARVYLRNSEVSITENSDRPNFRLQTKGLRVFLIPEGSWRPVGVLQIYDVSGRDLGVHPLNEALTTGIPIDQLTQGVYIAKVQSPSGNGSMTFIR